MSELKQINELSGGNVSISDNVLRTIANIATAEICGVSSLSGTFADDFVGIFGKKNNMKGVRIEENGDSVELNLSIIVNYGSDIPELCKAVQTSAKQSVEDMTGLNVSAVNIDVVDIIMNLGDKKSEK